MTTKLRNLRRTSTRYYRVLNRLVNPMWISLALNCQKCLNLAQLSGMTFRQSAFITLSVIILHLIAVGGSWYFHLWWFDVLMHFLGGVAMGAIALASFNYLAKVSSNHQTNSTDLAALAIKFIFILGFVALVGIAWEWLEFIVDHSGQAQKLAFGLAQPGLKDTMLDFYFDLLGAFLIFYGSYLRPTNSAR